MTRHAIKLLLLPLVAIAIAGCGEEAKPPLSAGECRQMLDKQRAMLAPQLGGMLEGAVVTKQSFQSDIDCDAMDQTMKEHGRDYYDCTMSSDSMEQLGACLASKSGT